MTRVALRRAGLASLLFVFAGAAPAETARDLTAVLTQIEGQVTLSPQSRTQLRSVRSAAQRQVFRRGEIVHLPAGTRATLVCSTEMLVSLSGPADWELDTATCGRGVPLPAGSYRDLTTFTGRILSRSGALLLELDSRLVDPRLGPHLLSPRDTAVLEPSPRLVWTRVADAVEYQIEIRGAVQTSIFLTADALECGRGSGSWQDLEVCSWTPSGRWPVLAPGAALSLKLGSRPTPAAPFRQFPRPYEIHRLAVEDQRRLEARLRQIVDLPLDELSRLLLTAGAYLQEGLRVEAMAAYGEAVQTLEAPEARVILGDLYLANGLMAAAEREYRQSRVGASDPAAQAAAELGLGYVAYFRKRFSAAHAHFERSRELYLTIGQMSEAENAREAAAGAQDPGSSGTF